ncbi:hypothetical protein [Microcella sp.]|uniref:hypothetical protein n=1 Tax=Microcella sp. TaxID=1913979 RepID=UPI00391D0BD2
MVEKVTIKAEELWRFRLDAQNPRHEPQSQQQDIVDYLTANEDVLPLLEDIAAQRSLSPFDRFGALRSGDLLIAIEGNRRLCSLMLLNDPELAPAKYRARVRAAAQGWKPELIEIDVAIFDTREEANPWLERRHQGALGGVGLKAWSAIAQGRHFGTSDNALALRLMSVAVERALITKEQGARRVLTTVRRFTDKESFRRNFLGITTGRTDPDYKTGLGDEVFNERLQAFFDELFAPTPTVTSRMSANDITKWVDDRLGPQDEGGARAEGTDDDQADQSVTSGSPTGGHVERVPESRAGDEESTAVAPSGGDDAPLPALPKVSRPASPTSRANLVDGRSFPDGTADQMRQYFVYELARIRKETPLAAALVARVLLESLYLDLWDTLPTTINPDSKLHTKVIHMIPHVKEWNLDRKEKAALQRLLDSANNSGNVLSPAALGAAAHGAHVPSWDSLVREWDALLPIIRRIMKHVETAHGHAAP